MSALGCIAAVVVRSADVAYGSRPPPPPPPPPPPRRNLPKSARSLVMREYRSKADEELGQHGMDLAVLPEAASAASGYFSLGS